MGWLLPADGGGGGTGKGVSSQAVMKTLHKHKGWGHKLLP